MLPQARVYIKNARLVQNAAYRFGHISQIHEHNCGAIAVEIQMLTESQRTKYDESYSSVFDIDVIQTTLL